MENKMKKVVAVLMVVGLMAVGPVAYAATEANSSEGGKGGKQGKGPKFEEMMKDLKLTPEQKEKLKAQREAQKESNKAAREQMKTKMEALHAAIEKPGATRADVAGLVGEVNALKAQMFAQRIDGVFAMKEILTPEQFAKMEAKRKEHMGKMRKHWGNKESKGSEGSQELQEPPEPPQD
ncbi:MAG: Spy/CpxP family protein refolding chaperone [Candidatus Omnitrophota bacterium]